jgi:hypothetical protein
LSLVGKFLDDQLIKIGGLNNTKRSPNIHLMGDFNFPAIDWNENTGPNSKHICQSEGQAFIDILNDHHMEQMVDGLSWSLYQQPKRVVIHRT